jgi:tellurite methyltransferase
MTEDLLRTTDIYLLDQILKGRFAQTRRIVDLGCGGGRNLPYFLQKGYEVHGIDSSPEAIEATKSLALSWNPEANTELFKVSTIEKNDLPPQYFDLVICNAVLHFAQSLDHFLQMLSEARRLLRPGGFFFARLASDIGIENLVKPLGNGRYLLPDGSERFLVNQQMILDYTLLMGGQLAESIKTTNVQNERCMTTWCMTV